MRFLLMYKVNYRTDIVNFLGVAYCRRALVSKILLFGGALVREWPLIRSFTVLASTGGLTNTSLDMKLPCRNAGCMFKQLIFQP